MIGKGKSIGAMLLAAVMLFSGGVESYDAYRECFEPYQCGQAELLDATYVSNEAGNAFWEKRGFTVREDLVYRNRGLAEMVRIDT